MDNTHQQSSHGLQQLIAQQKEKFAATSMTDEQRQSFNQSFQELERLAKELPTQEESNTLNQNQQILIAIGKEKKHPSTFTDKERALVKIYKKSRTQKELLSKLEGVIIRLRDIKIAPHVQKFNAL